MVTPGNLNRRAEFYHQLGSMISAGVPLVKTLEMASLNPSMRGSRRTIAGLIRNLEAGLTFSESMQRVQGWMPEFDIAMLSVGETSGRLDSSFRLLSAYYAARGKKCRVLLYRLAEGLRKSRSWTARQSLTSCFVGCSSRQKGLRFLQSHKLETNSA